MRAVILFDNLGPYHVARVVAAAKTTRLHVIEQWGVSSAHAWHTDKDVVGFSKTTLFPGASTRTTSRSDMHNAVCSALNQIKPDVVAIPGWSDAGAIAALGWCCKNQVPSVLMCTSSRLQERRSRLKETVKRQIVPLYSAGFGGGTPHRDYMVSLGMKADRVFLGYNAVDNDHFQRGADAARANESKVRAGFGLPEDYFLGSWRFIPEKNIPALLRAYAGYVAKVGKQAWKFIMLGDGPLRSEIVRLQKELRLQDHLILPGFIQYDDLPVYYGLARAFVLPSIYETWGLVINESMAAGLPVAVSTACGCHADLVNSTVNGWTFNPLDEGAITDIFLTIAENKSRLTDMGRASRALIADWSLEVFASSFERASAAAIQAGPRSPGFFSKTLLRVL